MLFVDLIGLGVGPAIVGLLTDHIFHERLHVGSYTPLSTTILSLAAALLLTIGRGPMPRAAVASCQADFS